MMSFDQQIVLYKFEQIADYTDTKLAYHYYFF